MVANYIRKAAELPSSNETGKNRWPCPCVCASYFSHAEATELDISIVLALDDSEWLYFGSPSSSAVLENGPLVSHLILCGVDIHFRCHSRVTRLHSQRY